MSRPTFANTQTSPAVVQGITTPYTIKAYCKDSSRYSVTHAELVNGEQVVKRIEFPRKRLGDLTRAVEYLKPALGAQVALDQARGEEYVRTFNYPKWQAERAAAAKEKSQ